MSQDQLTDLAPEEEAKLRDQYRQEMVELADKFCEERGYVLTNAEMTIEDFVSMRLKFGKFYCPCQPANDDDTICVCPPVLNGLVDFEGTCFCNFFSLPEGKQPLKETLMQEGA
jgi:ferredoxin-thioredoxin reductase catalytic subunit